jgi:hypothetical protein
MMTMSYVTCVNTHIRGGVLNENLDKIMIVITKSTSDTDNLRSSIYEYHIYLVTHKMKSTICYLHGIAPEQFALYYAFLNFTLSTEQITVL